MRNGYLLTADMHGIRQIESISIADGKEIRFGDVEIQAKQRFDVLYTPAYYHDQVLTTRQIYKAITGEDVMGDYHGIESSVYSIRKKLGRDVIQNVRGYGYQLKIVDINLIIRIKGLQRNLRLFFYETGIWIVA